MNVVFCIRPEYESLLGGDVIQMLKTKEFLERKFGLKIDVATKADEIVKKYDIAHIFNFSTYTVSKAFIERAVELEIPVVSSPVFWDYTYSSTSRLFYAFPFLNKLDESSVGFFRKIISWMGNVVNKPAVVSSEFKKNAVWMFNNSSFVAPNSKEEAELLMKWLNVSDDDKIRVVYNATDISKNQVAIDEELFYQKYRIPKNYILQVGRIEYCKNQLNLLVSLKDNPEIPIVFVGKVVDKVYFKKLNKIAEKRGNVFFIDVVPHNEIASFYRYAKLHVLMSLRESPGLVNIEALANDCPIVVSDKRFLPIDTYFENQPYVANPLAVDDIKNVVLKAYKEGKLTPFDFNKFSWDTVAEQTYTIYREILKNREKAG